MQTGEELSRPYTDLIPCTHKDMPMPCICTYEPDVLPVWTIDFFLHLQPLQLLSTADRLDYILMVVGTIGAM
eukprot:scaffold242639_cov18-Tisochrysis_lutea.AAC.1